MSALADYFKSIGRTVITCGDGMAVTFSHLLRKPVTIQYPDRTAEPVVSTLPERSRGFLEVDLDLCTGCSLCMKQCPIDCIHVAMEKNPETKVRSLTGFTIDIGKCMFCGICTEACKQNAIRHSHEFEGAMGDINRLNINFVEKPQPVAKPKKDEEPKSKPLGSIIRKYLKNPWAPAKNRGEK
jgi:formate hydrogenlyase subunit 6/NADH:ubiquinone oxidoreductase subunit I